MVKWAGLSHRGLRDWVLQRLTAVYLGAYVLFVSSYLFLTRPVTYTGWSALFSGWLMKIATVLCLMAIVVHAWIGIWTVLTDYVKCKALRASLYVVVWLGLFACLLWGVFILWSV